MEAVMLQSSKNQTISPNKSHIRNSMKIKHHSFNSRPAENYFCQPNFQAGILQTPHPFLYQSYPPHCLPQKPPTVFPQKNVSFSESRVIGFSSNRKPNYKTNDPSQAPKKISFSSNSPKKGGAMMKTTKKVARVSPDPKNRPKEDAPKMMVSSNIPSKGIGFSKTSDKVLKSTIDNQVDKITSSVIFTISPPPSSLPLPTFSLRPKLSCKAQAAGVDAGATDDLRRLLRLP
ncbi:hypothetical protein LIER_33582 [Lithospermum erythrorhizon]|uniref:Uncharacterized protein n=1 Tax=Lithospermum erythrorhizon TaxID=34254 RepID=A0AAV3RY21_LITER